MGRKSGKFNRIAALLFVSASAISFAQEGKVGINTESPRATMEITPTKKNNEDTATSNEGLIIPQLSKTRVANIDDQKLVKGTLIYVKETTSYTGTNPKVANIDASGFYHYNGTQWEKGVGGANTNTTPAENIYTSDGTLSGKRIINMDYSPIIFKNGSIGIDTDNPKADLDINGNLRVGYMPTVNSIDDNQIVVRGFDGIMKKMNLSDAFRSVATLNTAYYGVNTEGTLQCNKENDDALYLLPEGSLLCARSQTGGVDEYFWWYTGVIHLDSKYCPEKTRNTKMSFLPKDIHIERNGKDFVFISPGDHVAHWDTVKKQHYTIDYGRVYCVSTVYGDDTKWATIRFETTTALKVR